MSLKISRIENAAHAFVPTNQEKHMVIPTAYRIVKNKVQIAFIAPPKALGGEMNVQGTTVEKVPGAFCVILLACFCNIISQCTWSSKCNNTQSSFLKFFNTINSFDLFK